MLQTVHLHKILWFLVPLLFLVENDMTKRVSKTLLKHKLI